MLVFAIRQCIGIANDDAFITYRYARNLASGLGFVFNPGERILGTTTPLYTLLLTPVGMAEEFLPFASNAIGCIGVVLQAWAISRILLRLDANRFVAAAAALFVMGGGIGSYWYIGLETNLLAALLLWTVERFLAARFVAAGLLAGLATVCRFDAVLLAGLLLFEMLVHQRKTWREMLSPTLGFVGVVAPWLVFSKLYFGSLLPHSLQAKIHSVPPAVYAIGGATQMVRAQFALVQSHSPTWMSLYARPGLVVLAGAIFVSILLGTAIVKAWKAKQPIASALLFPVVLLGGYVSIGPPLEHTWHLYPAALFLCLGVILGILRLVCAWAPGRRLPIWFAWTSLAGLALIGFLYLGSFPDKYKSDSFYAPRARALAEMGQLVSKRVPPHEPVSAMEIGIIGYFCRNPIVDRTGIITPGLYYHNSALHTSLFESMRLRPTNYLVAGFLDLPKLKAMGRFEVLAVGHSPGYVPLYLLERTGSGTEEGAPPPLAR